jgi:hypothetical protein
MNMSAENVNYELNVGNASSAAGAATIPFGVFRTPEGWTFGWCNGTPADSTVGFAPHAIVIDTLGAVYVNTGSKSSATFTALTIS